MSTPPDRRDDSLPQALAQLIEGRVRAGRFPPGSKLPAERQLAIQLGASRNVLREALRILETRGLVEVRYGVGTFVTEHAASSHLTIPVGLRLEASQLAVEEITLARRVIECAIVEVAARARDDLDLQEMRSLLEATAAATEAVDAKRFIELDLAFHELLGSCTHNSILRQMQSELTGATATVRGIATETHDAMRTATRFHGEILDALAMGDGERARAVMLLHLSDAGERLFGALTDTAETRELDTAEPHERGGT
jgi:GntR family transcriptional regulator, transcriptional repressor for pyruvate dehydrogenase complex